MPVMCQECESEGNPCKFVQITSKHLIIAHSNIYKDLKTALTEYKQRWPDAPLAGKKDKKRDTRLQEALAKIDKTVVQKYLDEYSNDPAKMAEEKAVGLLLKLEAMEPYFTSEKERGQLVGIWKGQQAIIKEFLASRANVKKPKGQALTKEDMEELTDVAGRISEEMDKQNIKTIDPKFLEYLERGVPVEEDIED